MSSGTKQQGAPEPPWTQPNGIYATYDLHCHCGSIRYTMKLSPPLYIKQTEGKERYIPMECKCSWCERNGQISVHPLARDVEFTQGLEHRVEYRFASKKNPHWFCGKCGSVLGTDLTWLMENIFKDEARYTINARMLKEFDSNKLETRPVEMMKHVGPKYDVDSL